MPRREDHRRTVRADSGRLRHFPRHDLGRREAQWVKYKWTRGEAALGVSGQADQIQILQVSGEHADPAYATGRGLRLGDSRTRVEALYGTTFVEGHVTGPEIGERTVTYCYVDGVELSVGYDSADAVTAIRVTAPVVRSSSSSPL
jgi:hypothetical protein